MSYLIMIKTSTREAGRTDHSAPPLPSVDANTSTKRKRSIDYLRELTGYTSMDRKGDIRACSKVHHLFIMML